MSQTFRSSEEPQEWRALALQLMGTLQDQSEMVKEYDRAAESLLRELHETLTTTVEVLEAGEAERCLEAARLALSNLNKRIAKAAAEKASKSLGWSE